MKLVNNSWSSKIVILLNKMSEIATAVWPYTYAPGGTEVIRYALLPGPFTFSHSTEIPFNAFNPTPVNVSSIPILAYDSVTGNFTVLVDGFLRLTCYVTFTTTGSNDYMEGRLYRNGAIFTNSQNYIKTSTQYQGRLNDAFYAKKGEYFNFTAYMNGNGTATLVSTPSLSFLTIEWHAA